MRISREEAIERQAEFRDSVMTEIKREFVGCFRYIDLQDAALLYCVCNGTSGWVCVIGHPEHGSYEWAARHDQEYVGQIDRFYDNSDSGYGSAAYALRDGLNNVLED